MKFKNILLFLCLLMVMFTIAGVSASDANSTVSAGNVNDTVIASDANNDVIAVDDTQNEVLSVSNDDYVIADSQKTLKDLRNLINDAQGNTIKLNDDYIYDWNGDWSLSDGIEINRGLTIDGQGHTLDGGGRVRIFKVTGGIVTFKNIIFKNGRASGNPSQHGGAIMDYSARWVTAINCTFENNGGTQHAGALYYVHAVNCTFKNNHASKNGGAMYKGSAVNCVFIGNSATEGGALYDASAENCTFINNNADFYNAYAAGGGGAMYHNSAINCNFTGNSARSDGGAIYDGSAVNCYFRDNSAGISGGAMRNGVATNCTFVGNTASAGGGAMRYGNVRNCTFISTNVDSTGIVFDVSDTVVTKGGKVLFKYLPGCNLKVSVDGKEFTATDKGWNIGNLGLGTHNVIFSIQHKTNWGRLETQITVIPKTMSELKALIDNAKAGDTITLNDDYYYSGEDLKNGIIIDKPLTIDGRGYKIDADHLMRIFQVTEMVNVTIKNLNFVNGRAPNTEDGGAIWRQKGSVTVINCTFENNSATNGGALLDVNAINCTFINNDASNGGAIYSYAVGSLENCNFVNNKASSIGGAAYFEGEGSTAINCTFINNTARGAGALFFWESGTVTNCNFVNNKASTEGGAIYSFAVGSTMTNCNFAYNSAKNGGAIFCFAGWAANADTCIFKTSSDSTFNTRYLSPTLDVDNFVAPYNFGDKLTLDLKTNSGKAVTNGNISIKVYDKNDNRLVGEYSCLSAEGWIVDLPIGSYYAIFDTEYKNFNPINRTVTIIPDNTFVGLNRTINSNNPVVNENNGVLQARNDAVIELTQDYYFNPDYDGDFVNGIVIDRPIIVQGNGHTINANEKARIFQIICEGVDLRNIIFINGRIIGNGGAVLFSRPGSLENCNFINNFASRDGGAISFENTGNVTNCNFSYNTAGTSGGGIHGGIATKCIFRNNNANALGDAMRYATAIDCTFINDWVADSRVFATSPSGLDLISSNYIAGAISEYFRSVDFNLDELLPALKVADYNFYISDATDSIVDFIKGKNYEFNVTDISNALDKAFNGTSLDGKTILKSVSEFINGADLNLNLSGSTSLLDLLLHDTSLSGKDVFDSISKFINDPIFHESGVIAELDDYLNGTGFKGETIIESIREFLSGTNFKFDINKVSDALDRLLNGTGFSGAGIIGGISEFLDGKISSLNVTDVTNILNRISNRNGLNVPLIKDLKNFLNGMNNLNIVDVVSGWIVDVTNMADAIIGNIYTKQTPSNIIASKVSTTYGIAKNLTITLIDTNGNPITGKAIVIELDGKQTFATTNDAGKATFAVPKNLTPKTYSAKLKFAGDDKNAAANTTVEVSVDKATPKLTAKYDASSKNIIATVKDANGNPVSGIKVGFALDGVKYVTTDANGQALYSTKGLADKAYTVSVMAYGNEIYNDSNKETVKIGEKQQSKIFLRNALYFATQVKMVQVTLWDGNNQPLANKTVAIRAYDSVWHGVTDENGDAFIRVGIGFGTHDATVSFEGDDQYNASTRSGYIRVIKQTPSVMVRSADSQFKSKDFNKIVKVHLKDRYDKALPEGSKIVLKLNGKTYVGTTDINGVASIKINIYTVGTFTAQAMYGGNTAYNAVTRDVKIRIV